MLDVSSKSHDMTIDEFHQAISDRTGQALDRVKDFLQMDFKDQIEMLKKFKQENNEKQKKQKDAMKDKNSTKNGDKEATRKEEQEKRDMKDAKKREHQKMVDKEARNEKDAQMKEEREAMKQKELQRKIEKLLTAEKMSEEPRSDHTPRQAPSDLDSSYAAQNIDLPGRKDMNKQLPLPLIPLVNQARTDTEKRALENGEQMKTKKTSNYQNQQVGQAQQAQGAVSGSNANTMFIDNNARVSKDDGDKQKDEGEFYKNITAEFDKLFNPTNQ